MPKIKTPQKLLHTLPEPICPTNTTTINDNSIKSNFTSKRSGALEETINIDINRI